jgi:ketosteroid isomerase-like protein
MKLSFVQAAALTAALLTGAETMAASPEENIKVVQDFFTAYGAGDLEGIAEVMDENVMWHIPGRHPLSGTKKGRDEVLAFFAQLGVAGFKAEPIYFGADETHVVDIHRGWSNADGKPNVDTTWALLYRIEDGKIVEATNLSADQAAANTFFWSQYELAPVPERLAR